eukprot:1702069-Prymnesium_polylepis.1
MPFRLAENGVSVKLQIAHSAIPAMSVRGEVRASKDELSETAGIACIFGIQAETASHDTCQTLGETDLPYVCSAR